MIGLPNPWVILAVLIALGGSYKYGHHNGWWERDAEMQAEIAKRGQGDFDKLFNGGDTWVVE